MRITFGMFLDGAEWSPDAASLGEIRMGPPKLIDWLESRLGLSGVHVSAPERIDEYMRKIRHVDPEWSRASFELDPWSTAKQLLSWRDELVGNGWDGRSGSSGRLKALAALEADDGRLSPGIPDRMKAILDELRRFELAGTLVLQEPPELLPYLWKQVTDSLGRSGMTVIGADSEKPCAPAMIRLEGDNEFVLARDLTRFISAGAGGGTAIICAGDSSVLDGVFRREGVGRLNMPAQSMWRESLQILPLWLETLWKPFNPQRFLELLLLPGTPVPKALAEELIRALKKEPGRGGEAWRQAWENVRKRFFPDGAVDPGNPDFRRIGEAWTVLEERCFRAEKEIDAGSVVRHCDFLNRRLGAQIGNHPEFAVVTEHVRTMKKIVAGRTAIKQTELHRMLDSIIGAGTSGDRPGRERTDFAVFAGPGMIDRDFDTVLWWNCTGGGAAAATNWTADEIAVMPGYDRAAARKLESLSWRNALNHAVRNIVFFVPRMLKGVEVSAHPLLDELKVGEVNTLASGELTDPEGRWSLAGRTVPLEAQPIFALAKEAGIGANSLRPSSLSYSQLKTLISCPFLWFMQYHVGLRMPSAMTVPTGSAMLGTLAHKIVENIYMGKESLTVDEAVGAAGEEFERLLPSMAAELLMEERNVERRRIRRTLLDAVEAMAREIGDRELLVKGMEKELHGTFDGMEFVGYTDVYLEDAAGGKFVMDLKWSRSSSFYEKRLREGKALQLAAYSWLLDSADLNVRCAYFLFPKKQLVFEPEMECGDVWRDGVRACEQRLGEIHSGKLELGVGDERLLLYSTSAMPMKAECSSCGYAGLCRTLRDGGGL